MVLGGCALHSPPLFPPSELLGESTKFYFKSCPTVCTIEVMHVTSSLRNVSITLHNFIYFRVILVFPRVLSVNGCKKDGRLSQKQGQLARCLSSMSTSTLRTIVYGENSAFLEPMWCIRVNPKWCHTNSIRGIVAIRRRKRVTSVAFDGYDPRCLLRYLTQATQCSALAMVAMIM